jgi:murein L,D-transpeptidase YafK
MKMKIVTPALTILVTLLVFAGSAYGEQKADQVLVEKGESRLHLIREGEVFASFPVAFGGNPKGHKQQQGDERTPEGEYILDYKNANSSYYKSIHISYPNAQDRENARKRGVNPGGDIVIHGQKNGWGRFSFIAQRFNCTRGCVALSNNDMDAVWEAVDAGTPIEIRP